MNLQPSDKDLTNKHTTMSHFRTQSEGSCNYTEHQSDRFDVSILGEDSIVNEPNVTQIHSQHSEAQSNQIQTWNDHIEEIFVNETNMAQFHSSQQSEAQSNQIQPWLHHIDGASNVGDFRRSITQ
mgnify:FL=1